MSQKVTNTFLNEKNLNAVSDFLLKLTPNPDGAKKEPL